MSGEFGGHRAAKLIGRVVDGKWVLKECLGDGAMAPVFRATRRGVPIEKAVKILPPRRVGTVHEDRFYDEIRATAMIRHRNVIRLDDFGKCGYIDPRGVLYYVMEWIDGSSVKELMGGKALPPERALKIAAAVAGGLAAAHGAERTVLHRDIKPENIMVERGTGRVVVLDFGIAKFRRIDDEGREAPPLTQRHEVWSTPQYMSPEQATGSADLTVATDLYSLGVVLYEMLAGAPPFDGPDRKRLKQQHLNERAVPLRRVAPGVNRDTELLVGLLLEKLPQDRPESASAVVEAIRSILEGERPALLRSRTNTTGGGVPVGPPSGAGVVGRDALAYRGCVRDGHLPLRLFSVMLNGPANPSVHVLHSERVVLGRAPEPADGEDGILMADPHDLVSRRHALLERRDNRMTLTDLGSANGTRMDGVAVTGPTSLEVGDVFALGGAVWVAVGSSSSLLGDFFSFCRERHANRGTGRFCAQCGGRISTVARKRMRSAR